MKKGACEGCNKQFEWTLFRPRSLDFDWYTGLYYHRFWIEPKVVDGWKNAADKGHWEWCHWGNSVNQRLGGHPHVNVKVKSSIEVFGETLFNKGPSFLLLLLVYIFGYLMGYVASWP